MSIDRIVAEALHSVKVIIDSLYGSKFIFVLLSFSGIIALIEYLVL